MALDAVDLTSILNIRDEKIMIGKEKGIVWKESVMITADVISTIVVVTEEEQQKDVTDSGAEVQRFVNVREAEVESVKRESDEDRTTNRNMREEIRGEIGKEKRKRNGKRAKDPDRESENVTNAINLAINVTINVKKNGNQSMVTSKSKRNLLMMVWPLMLQIFPYILLRFRLHILYYFI